MIRILDIILSSFAIIILIPFMIPVVILLKFTGEHYIFYVQERVGKYGKIFKIIKFATMLKDSPNLPGGLYTNKNDKRLLPIGKIMRKAKINELPQLINILMGQMSIVGYRPTVQRQYNTYSEEVKHKIYKARPGLTGIGSIVFRNEEEILQKFEDKEDFHSTVINPYKLLLEEWYIDNNNVTNYFKIIFITVITVLNPDSKVWKKCFKDLPPIPSELINYI